MNRVIFIISGAILGMTIMLLPILLVMPSYQYRQTEITSAERFSTDLKEEVKAAQNIGKSDIGAVAFPSSLTHAGLIVILGLIIAFGTSLHIKRRVLAPSSAYFFLLV